MNRLKNIVIIVVLVSVGGACSLNSTSVFTGPAAETAAIAPAIRQAFEAVQRSPELPLGYVDLAAAYMKEARRTGDFALHEKAAESIKRALELSPGNIPARKLEAALDLSYHRFAEAIEAAEALKAETPGDSFVYGVLADAYIERGDYQRAIEAAQKMVDLKPGTASYSRVAQIRSLHGDHAGAVTMFRQAARAADPNDKESQSWCLVQLGDELWKNGEYPEAEKVYDEALANYPAYFLALVSKARLRASIGDLDGAEKLANEAQIVIPNANAILLLGDIYTLRGDTENAARQYETYFAMQERLGVAADHKRLILKLADRGESARALEMARAEYDSEPSIYSADLLAWTLYRNGKAAEAAQYIVEAMRLKTKDAHMMFHAGMIAKANGERATAKRMLSAALKLNPGFDILNAGEARRVLDEL